MTMTSNSKCMVPFIKVFTSLFLVPFVFTSIHLWYEIRTNKICFVGPSMFGRSDPEEKGAIAKKTADENESLKVDELYGIYRNIAPFQYKRIGSTRDQYARYMSWKVINKYGYPSLLPLTDDLNLSAQTQYISQSPRIEFSSSGLWNFVSGDDGKHLYFPDDLLGNVLEDGRPRYPPSGQMELYSIPKESHDDYEVVIVSCPAVAHPLKKPTMKRKNPTLQYIQECPAATLLIIINVTLAFLYWNNRVDPSVVCVEYQKIVHEHELWRSFTGALAHFEPLHIGFNMMSLYVLGMEVEPTYGTMPFLFCNICLIPLTTIVEMGMIWLRIRWTGNEQLKQRKAVGYSGVLFALMVVSSLERTKTCPIPFAASMCFKTYSKFGFKFNFGPVVQLLIAQVIMPRASFMGHLAGIICGFTLHWNLLPKEFFYMPHTLIPTILLLHLRYMRKIITCSYGGLVGSEAYVEMVDVDGSARSVSSTRKSDERQRALQLRRWMRNGMIVLTLMSMKFFNILGSIVWSQILATLCIVFAVRGEMRDVANIWKAAIISIILVIISDATHIPYWIKMHNHIEGKWVVHNILLFALFITIRCLGNFTALVLASEAFMELGISSGTFDYIFGFIIRSCHTIARLKLNTGNSTGGTWEAFQGQGAVLGRV